MPWLHQVLVVVILALGAAMLWLAVRDLIDAIRAARDLARAVKQSDADARARLRSLLETGDVSGAVAMISAHAEKLPPRERNQALDALTQKSETGRRGYARTVAVAAGLRA